MPQIVLEQALRLGIERAARRRDVDQVRPEPFHVGAAALEAERAQDNGAR